VCFAALHALQTSKERKNKRNKQRNKQADNEVQQRTNKQAIKDTSKQYKLTQYNTMLTVPAQWPM
jgi:predicted kinase